MSKFKITPRPDSLTKISDLSKGEFGVIMDGPYKHSLIYRNYHGQAEFIIKEHPTDKTIPDMLTEVGEQDACWIVTNAKIEIEV